MRKLILLFSLFTFSLLQAQLPPSWQWARTGTCSTTDNGSSVATDNSGNVFTTGYYFGSSLLSAQLHLLMQEIMTLI